MNKKTDALYCDWAATALFDKEIMEKAFEISLEYDGNPSSIHQKGLDAKEILNQARKRAAGALGVNENQIVFTSGGTESDFLPITFLLQRPCHQSLVLSNIEHPAVHEMAESMKSLGWKIIYASADKNGIVTAENIVKVLQNDTALVCVMAVNNETGAVQNIYEIADALTEWGKGRRRPKLHVDCVQAAGKIPLDLSYNGIDTGAISAHKIGGPRGCGILYLKNRQEPFLRGGGQENGIRSGTENIFGAVGISLALEKYFIRNEKSNFYQHYVKQCELTKNFIEKLKTIPSCIIIPEMRLSLEKKFSPYVVQAAFKNIPGAVMVRALSEKGVYISTGSACSSRKNSRPILDAMGISKDVSEWGVRFSFGYATSESDMCRLFDCVNKTVKDFN